MVFSYIISHILRQLVTEYRRLWSQQCSSWTRFSDTGLQHIGGFV